MYKKLLYRLMGWSMHLGSILHPNYMKKVGYKMFSTPNRLTLKPNQISFLETAENIDITFQDEKIRVYKWGSGRKKVLFCHGWQSHSFRWIKYIKELEKRDFTIFAMDAPASGQSTGSILNLMLYSMAIEKVIDKIGEVDYAVGHSMGAFALLSSIHRGVMPDLKKMVALACPGNVEDFVIEYAETMHLTKRTLRLVESIFEDNFGKKPSYFKTERFAKDLNLPGLIVHDKGDTETTFQHAENLHNVWKNSKLVATSGLSHKLRHKEIVNLVVNYLIDSTSVPAGTTELDFDKVQ